MMKNYLTISLLVLGLLGLGVLSAAEKEPASKVDDRLLRAELKMLRRTVKSQQEQIKNLRKEKDKVAEPLRQQIDVLKGRLAAALAENERLRKKIKGFNLLIAQLSAKKKVKTLPFDGDETPLTKVILQLKDNSPDYTVIGAISLIKGYDYGHSTSNVLFAFHEYRADGSSTGLKIHLLIRKKYAKTLVDAISDIVSRGYDRKFIRVKIRTVASAPGGTGNIAQILDWQFLDKEGKKWSKKYSQLYPAYPVIPIYDINRDRRRSR